MARHYLRSSGTTIHPDDDGFATMPEAKAALKECVAEDLARAKIAWKGNAVKVKLTDKAYRISAGRNAKQVCRDTPLWREWWIQTL